MNRNFLSLCVFLCWNIFMGIFLISMAEGQPFVTICWLLLNVNGAVLFGYRFARMERRAKYARYWKARKDVSVDNAVIPIVGPLPNFATVEGQSIYRISQGKSICIVSMSALSEDTGGHEGTIIYHFLRVAEHEVFHGISNREGLGIGELHLDHLAAILRNIPFHWSSLNGLLGGGRR